MVNQRIEPEMERIDSNLFICGDTVIYRCCQHGGCHGGIAYLPILHCYDNFCNEAKTKLPDPAAHSAFLRYAQLGYARETFKERSKKIKLSEQEVNEGLDNIAHHFQKAEREYLDSGFVPIDFTIPPHPIAEETFVAHLLTVAGTSLAAL